MAELDQEAELDAQKNAAVRKLARRLGAKKKSIKNDGAFEKSSAQDLDTSSLKLRQHDIHSQRLRNSIMASRERAADTLQKRISQRAAVMLPR